MGPPFGPLSRSPFSCDINLAIFVRSNHLLLVLRTWRSRPSKIMEALAEVSVSRNDIMESYHNIKRLQYHDSLERAVIRRNMQPCQSASNPSIVSLMNTLQRSNIPLARLQTVAQGLRRPYLRRLRGGQRTVRTSTQSRCPCHRHRPAKPKRRWLPANGLPAWSEARYISRTFSKVSVQFRADEISLCAFFDVGV